MINATTFTYAGTSCSTYGLKIAGFSDESVEENEVFSPSFSTLSSPRSLRLCHGGIKHETAPTFTMTVISETPLTIANRRDIMSWLLGRNEFKPLTFDSMSGYTFYCVFTGCSTVYVNGYCHGFTITGQLDSAYARGTNSQVTFSSSSSGAKTITNSSYIIDDYTYPIVQFTAGSNNSGVSIVNTTDDSTRAFQISGVSSGRTVSVNCETKTIDGCGLSAFNKNWLRLRKGSNSLTITTTGTITNGKIICPNYAIIGF